MNDITLLPCPFCNGKAQYKEFNWNKENHLYSVSCTECNASSALFNANLNDAQIAIEAWNKRV